MLLRAWRGGPPGARLAAMSSIFDLLAEQRIVEAIKRGELDGLPGAGKPLDLEEDPFVTPEQRMVNRVLKNAGFTPPEIALRKEIAELRREIEAMPKGARRDAEKRRLALLLIQLSEKG